MSSETFDPGRAVFDALVKDEDPRDRGGPLGLGQYAGSRDGKTCLDGSYDLARVGGELAAQLAAAEVTIAEMRNALEPLWQRARAPGAEEVPDDATVTVFMKDCREAARAAGK